MRCGHCQNYLTDASSKAYCLTCGSLLCTSCVDDTSYSESSTDDSRNLTEQREMLCSKMCRVGETERKRESEPVHRSDCADQAAVKALSSLVDSGILDNRSEVLDTANVYTERVSERIYRIRETIERQTKETKQPILIEENQTSEQSPCDELINSEEEEESCNRNDGKISLNGEKTIDIENHNMLVDNQTNCFLHVSQKHTGEEFNKVTVPLQVPSETSPRRTGKNAETYLNLSQDVFQKRSGDDAEPYDQESGYGSQSLLGSNETLCKEVKISDLSLPSVSVPDKTTDICESTAENVVNYKEYEQGTSSTMLKRSKVNNAELHEVNSASESENATPVVRMRKKKLDHEKRFIKGHSRSSSLPDLLKSSVERKSAFLSSNEQLSKSTVDLLENGTKGGIPVQMCDKDHKDVPKYICLKDNEIYCKVCVQIHNLHCKEKVKYIPEIPPEARTKACEDSTRDLLSARERLNRVKDELCADLQLLKDNRKEYVRSVMRFKQSMINLIDVIEKEALADMDLIYNIELEKFQKNLAKLESSITELDKLLAAVKIQETDETNSIFYQIQRASKSVTNYELDLHEVHKACFKTAFSFQPQDTITSILNSSDKLWTIKLTKDVKCRAPYPCTCDRSFKYRKAEFDKQFSAKLSGWSFDREKCYISGCAFLENGNLLLADNSNKKIKLFDKKYKCISALHLSSIPWDLTVLDKSTAVVSIPDKKQLQFFEAGQKLSLKHSVVLEKNCWGVARLKDLLVVTCWSRDTSEILVLDIDGVIKHTIRAIDRTPFKMPWYVSASSDAICVSDWGSNSLTFFTPTGIKLYEYVDGALDGAMGISSDPEGNIYVCGRETNNIHQVASKGGKVQTILTERDRIEKPLCVCHCPLDNRLVVTSWMSDTIKVFRLV